MLSIEDMRSDVQKTMQTFTAMGIRPTLQSKVPSIQVIKFVRDLAERDDVKKRGDFLCAIMRLDAVVRAACMEYVNRSAPYQTEFTRISARSLLFNRGGRPLRYTALSREMPHPRTGSYIHEVFKVIDPGESIVLEPRYAVDVLMKHCKSARPPDELLITLHSDTEYVIEEVGYEIEMEYLNESTDELINASIKGGQALPKKKPS